ncbi:hypothetical protein BDN70DRAFT_872809 [Pholiota conissans]|uniref:WW domain-containing protein n=1 Tax=Pholiota conissans TaxID=109636 RepID=A0A9P5ZAW7_9AGAR|nr:hypothetical protein BDN70DRAFT_872809 [Pholiota conissans]
MPSSKKAAVSVEEETQVTSSRVEEQPAVANEASSKSANSENETNDSDEQQEASTSSAEDTPAPTADVSQWQAIWSPQYNAYYFFNAATQETTWVNPLQPEASSSSGTGTEQEKAPEAEDEEEESSTGPQLSAVAAKHAALQAAALAQGIDPLLAHLDPTLLQSTIPGSSGPSDLPTFTAKFNARTGQFAPASSRTPGHLSEFERAKRMSEFYFDVNKWEEDLAKRGGRLMGEEGEEEETGKKRKRPSKKDLERFKEQKRLKKIAKTAWLRT